MGHFIARIDSCSHKQDSPLNRTKLTSGIKFGATLLQTAGHPNIQCGRSFAGYIKSNSTGLQDVSFDITRATEQRTPCM